MDDLGLSPDEMKRTHITRQANTLGLGKNFLSMLARTDSGFSYFAFCDQDDIWHHDKLSNALAALRRYPPDQPALYCACTIITDESCEIEQGISSLYTRPPSFANALVEMIACRNAILLNRAARDIHAIGVVLENGQPGEIYNIGGLDEKSNIDVVRTIYHILDDLHPISGDRSISGYGGLTTHIKDRPGHDRRYAINASRIEQELGWRPTETFETGIRKTVAWYLEHQSWVETVISGDYRTWIKKHYQ